MSNALYRKEFPCGHKGNVTRTQYYQPACPACMKIAQALASAKILEPEIVKGLKDFAFQTPTGRPKPLEKTLAHIATLDPELVPKCAAIQDSIWDWARHSLAGTKPERKMSGSAKCAMAIKAEFETVFKGLKIRAHSSNFANGNSVTISANFKCQADLDRAHTLASKYQYGHFDGMTDMYEYSNPRSDVPQAKFVSVGWDKVGG